MSAGRSRRSREDDGRGVDEGAREVYRERENEGERRREVHSTRARISRSI